MVGFIPSNTLGSDSHPRRSNLSFKTELNLGLERSLNSIELSEITDSHSSFNDNLLFNTCSAKRYEYLRKLIVVIGNEFNIF